MSLPALLPNGYLPPGVHEATLGEVVRDMGQRGIVEVILDD
jgi:hypothetical protein